MAMSYDPTPEPVLPVSLVQPFSLVTLWKKGERYDHEKYYIAMTEPLLREANVI